MVESNDHQDATSPVSTWPTPYSRITAVLGAARSQCTSQSSEPEGSHPTPASAVESALLLEQCPSTIFRPSLRPVQVQRRRFRPENRPTAQLQGCLQECDHRVETQPAHGVLCGVSEERVSAHHFHLLAPSSQRTTSSTAQPVMRKRPASWHSTIRTPITRPGTSGPAKSSTTTSSTSAWSTPPTGWAWGMPATVNGAASRKDPFLPGSADHFD